MRDARDASIAMMRSIARVVGWVCARVRAVVGRKRARDAGWSSCDAVERDARASGAWTTRAGAENALDESDETGRRVRRRLDTSSTRDGDAVEASEMRDDADAIICSDALDSADDFATDIDANTTTAAISAPLRLVGGFECVQSGADDDLDDVDDAPDVPFETDDAVTDDAPSLTLDDFNEDECALALDAISPPSPPPFRAPSPPPPPPLRRRLGRGYQRRAGVSAMNHGLHSTDRFFEAARLSSSLYSKVPMPCESTPSAPVHFSGAMSLEDDYVSLDVTIGNWTREVRVLADDRRARFDDADTRREMREALTRIADEREAPAKTVMGPMARKRPIAGSLKTYRCRAYPTRDQERLLKKFARLESVDAYNAAVRMMNAARDANVKQPSEIELVGEVRAQFDFREVPVYVINAGVRRAVAARGTNERKRELAVEEGREPHEYTLHERSETGSTTLMCTFGAQQKGIKHVRRAHDASKTCLLNFDYRAHAKSAVRQLGTIKIKERKVGDLDSKIRFDVFNAPKQLVQKEDVTFEFDKRRNRWYACFVYDDETTPGCDVSVEHGDVAVLDLGLTPPATVFSPTTSAVYNPFPTDFDAKRLAKWRAIEKLQKAISTRKWARLRKEVGVEIFRRPRHKYRRTTQRMKATLARKHLNFVEWVRNVHQSVANHLVREYDFVGCPPLDGNFFARHANDTTREKAIKRRSRRKTQGQALSKFTKTLQNAAYRDGKVIVTDRAIESGTSKTCGDCGAWNANLGFAKTFECHECGLRIDRDMNGARNNTLQLLADGGFGRQM